MSKVTQYLLLALVVIAAGGGAYYWFVVREAEPAVETIDVPPVVDPGAAAPGTAPARAEPLRGFDPAGSDNPMER